MCSQATGKVTLSLQHQFNNDLFSYRNIPFSTMGSTLAELFIIILKPLLNYRMQVKQRAKQLGEQTCSTQPLHFVEGELVWVHSGQVQRRVSLVTYQVYVQGRGRFYHADHIRKWHTKPSHEGGASPHAAAVKPLIGNRDGSVRTTGAIAGLEDG
ncbi:hypothetical protein PR048_023973 [Dryococelus australis]|uniref:Uncharacterized protein n=1 Tax=Dryococelus australis TaxID=614101 RepID=A0ABQ9GVK4_9NEOP|nr:hypothetical protein PR048_023973 [Dryococelus australis]